MSLQVVSIGCLVWYFFILTLCITGAVQLHRYNSRNPSPPVSPKLPNPDVPRITILRPVKGLEPYLYECLAATFYQDYPVNKLTIYFCISSRNDPAYPILEHLLSDFRSFDAKILVEEEDPNLVGRNGREHNLGPNPKIRNMSRGYREAKGDIMWIIDCNVWINKTVAGLMVDKLCGFGPTNQGRKYKFVHQLPLVVDVSTSTISGPTETEPSSPDSQPPSLTSQEQQSFLSFILSSEGGLLEELFLSTSHAKFYTAISTVAIAPCTVGKSNMFRLSHLNALTPSTDSRRRSPGIDFFSHNICEDHLIGDLLWKTPVPRSIRENATCEGGASIQRGSNVASWGHHAVLLSPSCIQPLSNMPLAAYVARRARWLRVRKFTVPVATLIEPGTESLLCSLYGAFGFTTLHWSNQHLHIPRTWAVFWVFWAAIVGLWMLGDWMVWKRLQEGMRMEADAETPAFVRRGEKGNRMGFGRWVRAWLGREVLAGPIWAWAVFGGVTVLWRGRRFRVGMDMRVREVDGRDDVDGGSGRGENGWGHGRVENGGMEGGWMRGKSRVD